MEATQKDIQIINTLKIDNNRQGTIGALSKNGIPVNNTASRSDLGAKLLSLYNSNQPLYATVIASIPFNANAGNYTTSPQMAEALKKDFSASSGNTSKYSNFNFGDITTGLGDFISGKTSTTNTTTTTVAAAPVNYKPLYIAGGMTLLLVVILVATSKSSAK